MPSRGEKKKTSGSHKHSSKSGSSKQQRTDANDWPEYLTFLWTIDAVEATYDEKHPRRYLRVGGSKDNDIARFWFPPNTKSQIKLRQRGNLYRWMNGKSEQLKDVKCPKNAFAVASIFFQDRQDNFLVSPKDCTQHNLDSGSVGWCHLTFNHLEENLSEVEFGAAQHYGLAAPVVRDSTWMPQVLPEVYNYRKRANSRQKEFSGPLGGLCGKLSLLIGMAAFSAEVERAEEVVAHSFRDGEWIEHDSEIGIGRYEGRGVVVKIYLDPEEKTCTEDHLVAFEQGKYGPIFANRSPDVVEYEQATSEYAISGANHPTTDQSIPRLMHGFPGQTEPTFATYPISPVYGQSITSSAPLDPIGAESQGDLYYVSDEEDTEQMRD